MHQGMCCEVSVLHSTVDNQGFGVRDAGASGCALGVVYRGVSRQVPVHLDLHCVLVCYGCRTKHPWQGVQGLRG